MQTAIATAVVTIDELRTENERLRRELACEREANARVADSFGKDYGPEVSQIAKRIARIIRRQPSTAVLSRKRENRERGFAREV